ncbi:MAG: hypothetical protein K0Q79_2992 [Flavipsychrobacter sp.]|jgi:gas vesicle protein|nr:hypothetical protein [Flavipsychrobacter sp.]
MTTARKILYTVAAGFVLGAIAGILYAPVKGAETRRKLNRLRNKLGFGTEDTEREALAEVKGGLQQQLKKIDAALEE